VFKLKLERSIQDFLGCEIIRDNGCLLIGQERIVNKLKNLNKNLNESVQWTTPSALNFFVVRPRSKAEMITTEKQKDFRSIVGTLLYLVVVKLSKPDIANPVRELSKVMDGAAPGHEKELKRLRQFVIQTKERKLNIKHRKMNGKLKHLATPISLETKTREKV
jgi:hypothetical protein